MTMIEIKRATEFPWGLPLGPIGAGEIRDNIQLTEFIMNRSRAWIVSQRGVPIFLVGVLKLTLVGGAHRVWLVTFEGFQNPSQRVLKFMKRAIRRLKFCLGQLSITVDDEDQISKRFAQYLGFEWSTHLVRGQNGVTYRSYYMR